MLPFPFDILRYTVYLMRSITTLDDNWMGRPRSIATALLESDGHRAIVDCRTDLRPRGFDQRGFRRY